MKKLLIMSIIVVSTMIMNVEAKVSNVKLPDLMFVNSSMIVSGMANGNYKVSYQLKNVGTKNLLYSTNKSVVIACYNKNSKKIYEYVFPLPSPSLPIGKSTSKKSFVVKSQNFPLNCAIDMKNKIKELNKKNNIIKVYNNIQLEGEISIISLNSGADNNGLNIPIIDNQTSNLQPQTIQCDSTTHNESGICVSNVKSCPIANGQGNQTWGGYSWGNCIRISCNVGYENKNGVCTEKMVRMPGCNVDNIEKGGVIRAGCDSLISGSSIITYYLGLNACPSGYKMPSINDFLSALGISNFSSFNVDSFSSEAGGVINEETIHNLITSLNLSLKGHYNDNHYFTSDGEFYIGGPWVLGQHYYFSFYKITPRNQQGSQRNLRCIKE